MDGEFSGSINSQSIITVGKGGLVEGDVSAKKLIVTGRFKGDADCDEIEILSGGKVVGKIVSKVLVIERGSFFEGDSRLKNKEASEQKALPKTEKPAILPPPAAEKPGNGQGKEAAH